MISPDASAFGNLNAYCFQTRPGEILRTRWTEHSRTLPVSRASLAIPSLLDDGLPKCPRCSRATSYISSVSQVGWRRSGVGRRPFAGEYRADARREDRKSVV